jgi:hypothetical protein
MPVGEHGMRGETLDTKTISVKEAWDALHKAYDRDVKRRTDYSGTDWCEITPEEKKVFRIADVSMPRVVTAYRYYEEILDLTSTDILPPAVMAVIRKDAAERFGMQPGMLCHTQFENFARQFGISRRTAHAWFIKHEFWCVRQGIQGYDDDDAFLY